MKLKKFNEYVNPIKQLDLSDLSMWLRKGDDITINDSNGINTYIIKDIDELGIYVMNKDENVQTDFKFEYLNSLDKDYAWEIISINEDDVIINEKHKNV